MAGMVQFYPLAAINSKRKCAHGAGGLEQSRRFRAFSAWSTWSIPPMSGHRSMTAPLSGASRPHMSEGSALLLSITAEAVVAAKMTTPSSGCRMLPCSDLRRYGGNAALRFLIHRNAERDPHAFVSK
jgi:hypothetical protein